jgi:4'-phosphopantetheinyl transferase
VLPEPPQRAAQNQVSEQLTLRLFGEAGVVVHPAELGRTIYGKPQLRWRRDCAFHHSISNTGPITVGVLSEGAIGIDVEVENRRIGVSPHIVNAADVFHRTGGSRMLRALVVASALDDQGGRA